VSYLRIDDAFPEHPKVHPLDDRAFRLHMHALCYCARNLTNGVISSKGLRQLLGSCDAKPRHVKQLVEHGLWHEDDAYRIHDYLEKNPTADEVRELRKARSEAGRRGGTTSGRNRKTEANGEATAQASAWPSALKQNGKQPGSTPYPSQTQTHATNGSSEESLEALPTTPREGKLDNHVWKRLTVATGARTPDAIAKLERTLVSRRSTTADVVCAIEAATGNGVRDPLAVALSELVKRAEARAA
jgi:hypothetical protein